MDILSEFKGIVIHGKKRGKGLGFPTANFKIDLSTPPGTYLSTTTVLEKVYPSITFIGTVDTFDETDFIGESYILDFDQDIYGEKIIVKIIKKLRDNQKFESVEKLIRQMKKDEEEAKDYFSSKVSS